MKFHFTVGDSVKGPIGFKVTMIADSKREAVKKLQAALGKNPGPDDWSGVGIFEITFNPGQITTRDIDEVTDS